LVKMQSYPKILYVQVNNLEISQIVFNRCW